ncbi:unnamed protein product [Psylliodes chrysocephalus]|uniref:Uncharacterized protein n=1 Tax=Psylliodes chrysocephalus TaxID=3402493 RepID=A0A9P0CSD7_9CUCU|nr:unnamed protein product [Psylliodes chrysocephala]
MDKERRVKLEETPAPANSANEHDCEIVKQLKVKFAEITKRCKKMLVLSVLPISWTRAQIQKEFSVSQYMARAVKKMVKEKGIFSTPNPKPGKTILNYIFTIVREFYLSEDISRMMPGNKDCVVIEKEDRKEYVQKNCFWPT